MFSNEKTTSYAGAYSSKINRSGKQKEKERNRYRQLTELNDNTHIHLDWRCPIDRCIYKKQNEEKSKRKITKTDLCVCVMLLSDSSKMDMMLKLVILYDLVDRLRAKTFGKPSVYFSFQTNEDKERKISIFFSIFLRFACAMSVHK